MDDVFTILIPYNVNKSYQLKEESYDLFEHYMKLDTDLVAQSNSFYNRYCEDKFIGENLTLTYNMLKLNTDETLFNKCLEEYDRYHPLQQGGPLMLSLILKKINSGTEQQLDYLKHKAKSLRISSLEGENVDKAISLLNAALNTFKSASTKSLDRKPIEWEKDLISIFQTSTVSSFNNLFHKIQDDVRQAADMSGGAPQWPSHEDIIRLASATYNRQKLSGEWDIPSGKRAMYGGQTSSREFQPGNPNRPRKEPTCWNCGKTGHVISDCRDKLDQAKIDKGREAWRAGRKDNKFNSNFKKQRANVADATTKSKKNRKKKNKAEAATQGTTPQANVAAIPSNPYGYTNRNLEDAFNTL